MSKLILVPTPLDDYAKLDDKSFELILSSTNSVYLIESFKISSKLKRWQLPSRELIPYNEHNMHNTIPIIELLKQGKDAFLFSDGGMPAICDPGVTLVRDCHLNNLEVTSTPFNNSIILALALSGLNSDKYTFQGFLSANNQTRKNQLKKILNLSETQIILDTPYRLNHLLKDLNSLNSKRIIFLACNLGNSSQKLIRGKIQDIVKQNITKEEFVLIIGSKNDF